ncbi:hypothetical protein LINGRAHAP2_LOCUS25935 [Linum grandiflorum]
MMAFYLYPACNQGNRDLLLVFSFLKLDVEMASWNFLQWHSMVSDEWLITPPGTPLFPSLEMESQRTVMSQIGTPKASSTVLKSRVRSFSAVLRLTTLFSDRGRLLWKIALLTSL